MAKTREISGPTVLVHRLVTSFLASLVPQRGIVLGVGGGFVGVLVSLSAVLLDGELDGALDVFGARALLGACEAQLVRRTAASAAMPLNVVCMSP